MSSSSTKCLNSTWIGILVLTVVAFVALIVSMVKLDVQLFDEGAFENGGDCISSARAFVVAIWAMIISLTVSSYGFWRDSVSSKRKRSYDMAFSGGAAAAGSMTLVCAILFFFVQEFGQEFGEGEGFLFLFSFCSLLLAILYFALDVITIRNGSQSSSSVDNHTLI